MKARKYIQPKVRIIMTTTSRLMIHTGSTDEDFEGDAKGRTKDDDNDCWPEF